MIAIETSPSCLSFPLPCLLPRHPNVSSQNGAICLDILKDQWTPALTLKTAMLSLQALLSSPEPNDPQDAIVARQVRAAEAVTLWTPGVAGDPYEYFALSALVKPETLQANVQATLSISSQVC